MSSLASRFDFLRFFCRRHPTAALEQWDSEPDRNGKIRSLVLGEDGKIDSNHAT